MPARRSRLPFSEWTWDQVVLILVPVLVSVILVALYAAGALSMTWPTLLIVVLMVNLAGDVAYAFKNEHGVKHRRVPLCNDIQGNRAVAESEFAGDRPPFKGVVRLAGERWRAVSDSRISAGTRIIVVGRRGLVLEVDPDGLT